MTELRSKRLLVTGGAGFLGRHVCRELATAGVDQVTVARRAEYDLTEQSRVRDLLGDTRPDVVIHLAAEVGGIGANMRRPGRFFYANSVMGAHLIEESRVQGVEKFVQVGTVCSYPERPVIPFRESDLFDGYPEPTNAPYGIAKRGLYVMLDAYRTEYGFNGISLVPSNLYGPGDDFALETSHVIPALIRRLTDARDRDLPFVDIWGTGSASREFLHAADAARAIVMAAAAYDEPDPVNLGTGIETTIRDLVGMIAEIAGFTGDIRWDATKPDGQPRRCLDVSRARDRFGFEARIGLRDGLADTVSWWEASGKPESAGR